MNNVYIIYEYCHVIQSHTHTHTHTHTQHTHTHTTHTHTHTHYTHYTQTHTPYHWQRLCVASMPAMQAQSSTASPILKTTSNLTLFPYCHTSWRWGSYALHQFTMYLCIYQPIYLSINLSIYLFVYHLHVCSYLPMYECSMSATSTALCQRLGAWDQLSPVPDVEDLFLQLQAPVRTQWELTGVT